MDPKILSRLDLQPARTPADLERKYNLSKLARQVALLQSSEYRTGLIRQAAEAMTGQGRMAQLELPADRWEALGETGYVQTLSLKVDAASRVDLYPDPEQTALLHSQALAITTENRDGTLRVYALGARPGQDLSFQALITGTGPGARLLELELPAGAWESLGQTLFCQRVTPEGITPRSRINLDLSPEQALSLFGQGTAITLCNEEGLVTALALGSKPSRDYTLQATVKEVSI